MAHQPVHNHQDTDDTNNVQAVKRVIVNATVLESPGIDSDDDDLFDSDGDDDSDEADDEEEEEHSEEVKKILRQQAHRAKVGAVSLVEIYMS